ncbi:MAG: phosphoketolase family protein [Patescibacteria group bacterium]
MISSETLQSFKLFHRLTNYIGAAMLYLQDNQTLERELLPADIKPRILGHWGTVPGINFIYGGLNHILQKNHHPHMLIVGPGHGAPAILANLWLEGTLQEYYPIYSQTKDGLNQLIHDFSWPGGFPSHTYPGLPGSIHEGGELGYSLGVAYGAVMDNPDLIVPCIIGDGEAETGALAASWHSPKFINPLTDGVVIPILHLNGYKISNPTVFNSLTEDELNAFFTAHGYEMHLVDQYQTDDVYSEYLENLEKIYAKIEQIKQGWEQGHDLPHWPMLVLRTKKGWTGPVTDGYHKLEDNNLSHGIPLKNPKTDPHELNILQNWLSSYHIEDLLQESGEPIKKILDIVPEPAFRLGKSPVAFGGQNLPTIKLPDLAQHQIECGEIGCLINSEMSVASNYLRDILKLNQDQKNFRIFSPDESESNKLDPIFQVSGRRYLGKIREWDQNQEPDGRMLEILSEQTLQSWMAGYNMTGRNSILISYEAFLSIITSQIDQYIKYLRQCLDFNWRNSVPSLNYIATSSVWRQDHNGFTHQNPILINSLLAKHVDFVNVYFPSDANSILATLETCFKSRNSVNLIISGKTDLPQWLTLEQARRHVQAGMSQWNFAGMNNQSNPDIVLSSAGDYQTLETLAGISILKQFAPEINLRYVNINQLNCLGLGYYQPQLNLNQQSNTDILFTTDKPVILNFHGYPEAVKQIVYGTPLSMRLKILGYLEKGTTTTPFDMQIKNQTSRYHVAIETLKAISEIKPELNSKYNELINQLEQKILQHKQYIQQHGEDMPEIQFWKWKA